METLQMTSTKEVQIRFNEVDSLSIVWHGNYVKYLEDGREDFGRKFGIGYLQVKKAGYIIPIVDLQIQFKKSLYYGESVLVETTFVETETAKMFFKYRLISPTTNEVLCVASTTQVFLDKKGVLQLTTPDFFQNWKKRWFA